MSDTEVSNDDHRGLTLDEVNFFDPEFSDCPYDAYAVLLEEALRSRGAVAGAAVQYDLFFLVLLQVRQRAVRRHDDRLVEDDDAVRSATEKILRSLGYRVIVADDPRAAIALASDADVDDS